MNENFPKLNSANFTITDDFKKDLARPDYRIILFKVVAHSRGNGTDRETFAYCDYIDEDVIVADLPYKDFGDIQATSLKFMYLPIENDNYRSFLASNASISSVMNNTRWKLAFDEINLDEGEGNLILEPTGSNYIFFDFSDYDLNCSIQLLNTFDKNDREFIHSHYHSKNLGHTDILSTDGYLGYYDDIEYSKFNSSETNTLRNEIKIDSDKFSDGTKPSELKLNHKSNFVRMFRPEEYYHMGEFTVKLLGKPLQETKYKYASEDVNNADKLSREDLKVLGVTNPKSEVTDERDLQYVDMFDYNKYLQPVFRMWDKNANPTKISYDNPYLYTIKKFAVDKSFMTFFRCMSSDGYFEVTLTYRGTSGSFSSGNLYSTIKYTANSNVGDDLVLHKDYFDILYKVDGSKFQVYFKVGTASKKKSLTLLEAGIRNDLADKDSMTLITEIVSGTSGTTVLPKSNKVIVNQNKLTLEIASGTGNPQTKNLWSGDLLPSNYEGPNLTLTSLEDDGKNQYAKFMFTEHDTYNSNGNPWSASGNDKIEVSVTLLGGKIGNSTSDNVALGVPYLCVTKGMKVLDKSYLSDIDAGDLNISNITVSGTTKTKYLSVTSTSTFDGEATFKSTVKFYNTFKYEGKSTRNFLRFVKTASDGDGLILAGCQGLTAIGSGEACGDNTVTDLTTINSKFNQTSYHPGVSSFAPSSATEWTGNNEELMLLSDNNVFVLTNGQDTSRLYQFKNSESKFIVYGGSQLSAVKVTNNNGSIELHTNTWRGLYDPGTGKWLIGSNADGNGTTLQAGDVTISNGLHVNKTLTVDSTSTFKNAVSITGNLTVTGSSTKLKGTKVEGNLEVTGKLTSASAEISGGINVKGAADFDKNVNIDGRLTVGTEINMGQGSISFPHGPAVAGFRFINASNSTKGDWTYDMTNSSSTGISTLYKNMIAFISLSTSAGNNSGKHIINVKYKNASGTDTTISTVTTWDYTGGSSYRHPVNCLIVVHVSDVVNGIPRLDYVAYPKYLDE